MFYRGKWYAHPDKGHELSDNDVQGGFAGPNGETVNIAASGRSWTPTGTEGHFDIYHGGVKVCNVYFDCPFSHIHNNFEISEVNDQYVVQATGQSLDRGALGDITIKVVKIQDERAMEDMGSMGGSIRVGIEGRGSRREAGGGRGSGVKYMVSRTRAFTVERVDSRTVRFELSFRECKENLIVCLTCLCLWSNNDVDNQFFQHGSQGERHLLLLVKGTMFDLLEDDIYLKPFSSATTAR